ncbi:uncharacterized protein BN796_00274 [Alistipes sp. CAG:831]|nr:uncharacterized protein BN796_00274 [Alistipes sp. CAG:831]
MKKIIIYTAAALLVSGLSGCKDWLDINTDPNNATTALMTEALLLPAQQYDMLNNHVNSTNAWMLSHHLTKSGEVSGNYTFLNGQVMPQDLDSWWSTYYSINWNLKFIHDLAVENEDPAYQAISEVLQVINFQRMVDIWGNIPYTEAINPEEYNMPKYDKAEDIYTDLIARAHAAAQMLESAQGNYNNLTELESVDIMCHGDLAQWTRLAYTIEFRLLMRVSAVRDVSAQLTDIYQKCLSIEENVEANPGYLPETDKMQILYEAYGWDKNGGRNNNHRYYMPTKDLVDMLRTHNDPRLRVYADPRRELGDDKDGNANYSRFDLDNEYYVGIPYGQANPAGEEYTTTTGTGLLAGSSDKNNGRLRSSTFIAGSEIGFLLAEAALQGYIPGGEAAAKDYYERAVISAFNRHEAAMQDPTENFTNYVGGPMTGMKDPITGSAEDAARAYLDQNDEFCNWDLMSSKEEKLYAICAQRWLAFVGYNPLEAWIEHRRTDMPDLESSNQSPQTKNYCRLPYPQTERNLNAANVMAEPEINVFESTVFWDVDNPTVLRAELYL